MHPSFFFNLPTPRCLFFFFFFCWGQLSGGSCSRDRLSVSRVARIEEDPVTRCFGCFIIIIFYCPSHKSSLCLLAGKSFLLQHAGFLSAPRHLSLLQHCLGSLEVFPLPSSPVRPLYPPCTRRDVCHIDDGPVLLSPTSAILSVPIAFLFLPMLVPTVFFSFFPSYYLRLALLLVTIKCGFMRRGAYCRKIRDVCTLIRNCVFVTSVSGAKDGSTKRLDSDAFAFLVQTTCQPCFLARWP